MKLIDAVGHRHSAVEMRQAPPRIVSLVPSITELLCDLGLAHWLVGRTGFCVHPAAAVAGIAKVGGTKDVNVGKIRALAATHLIVNIDENQKPTVEALAQFVPHVIVTHPLAPSDNVPLYRLLGGIFGASGQAELLCSAYEREYEALLALPARPSKTVLYCIWQDPWMTVSPDTYIAAMLGLIGWRHWRADSGSGVDDSARYPQFAWNADLVDAIDDVLLSSEPYRFTEAHASALEQQIGKPVHLVDGEMLSWYGSRAIQGLRYLQELARIYR
jgi:ABC-type Fe3+-hydroxamate transport system substrate-binding protein